MLSFLLSSILIILIKTCAGNSCVYYLATDRCEIKGLLLRDVLMSEITPVWSLNGPAVCVFVSVWSIGLALPTCLVYCYHDNPYIAPSQHHMVAMVTSPPFFGCFHEPGVSASW